MPRKRVTTVRPSRSARVTRRVALACVLLVPSARGGVSGRGSRRGARVTVRGRARVDAQYGLLTSIASEARVSLSTVSKVVHRRHDVGAATRARVEELERVAGTPQGDEHGSGQTAHPMPEPRRVDRRARGGVAPQRAACPRSPAG
ncbi:LacI family DNA-binding transcriptional regulator [Streptomyces sp. GTA36]